MTHRSGLHMLTGRLLRQDQGEEIRSVKVMSTLAKRCLRIFILRAKAQHRSQLNREKTSTL